jgi:APA family basic amino acid/polyamine antiporter
VDAVAVLVGIIIGSGIFVTPAAVTAATRNPLGAAGLWILGGIVATCGGLCYAECGARLPQAGGFFVFCREAFGDSVAFVAGWAALLVTYPSSIAAIAHVFADYLAEFVPGLEPRSAAVAVALVLVAGTLNALGVRLGAWTQRILTGAKIVALAALSLAALLGKAPVAAVASVEHSQAGGMTAALLVAAAVGIMFTFDGWTDTPLLGGELRDPGRTLGRTVAIGMSIVIALYVCVQVAVDRLLPPDVAASSNRVFADAVEAGLGTGAGRLVALLIVVSAAGSVNAIILTSSRIPFAMARASAFPAWFGTVNARTASPIRSVLVLVAITMVYALVGSFGSLVACFTFTVWIFYALAAVALLRLRQRKVGEPLTWHAPLGLLPPIVVMVTAVFMTTGLVLHDPGNALIGLAILLLGFPAFHLWRRLDAHRNKLEI